MSAGCTSRPESRQTQDFLAWRQSLALFITTQGYAQQLVHVEETHWYRAFELGIEPARAALSALPLEA
jgi:hypothetical protein